MMLVRFLIGGLVVSLVPVVTRQFGPAAAALLVLIPAITLVSYAVIGHGQGEAELLKVVSKGFPALLAVAAFIAGTYAALLMGAGWPLALVTAMACWGAAAALIVHGPKAILGIVAAAALPLLTRPALARAISGRVVLLWQRYTALPWTFRFASTLAFSLSLMPLLPVAPVAAVVLLVLSVSLIVQSVTTMFDYEPSSR